MAQGGPPGLAPPAGGFKWKDDEYWNKHEGLMTVAWPHQYEGRERVKNKPMTINARTLSCSNGLGRARPSTVPTNMPSQGRRFLDNIDSYMGRPAVELDSEVNTPGRPQRSPAKIRSASAAQLSPAADQHRGPFKDNMYFFNAGMGRAEPLGNTGDQDRIAYGLAPIGYSAKPLGGRRLGAGPMMIRNMGGGAANGSMPFDAKVNGVAVAYTNNQQYGTTAQQGERPSSAAHNGRKKKTTSNVVMGM